MIVDFPRKLTSREMKLPGKNGFFCFHGYHGYLYIMDIRTSHIQSPQIRLVRGLVRFVSALP